MIDERDLEKLAPRLGDRAAERIDPNQVASDVLARVAAEAEPIRWWRRPALLRIAAAVTLVAGASFFALRGFSGGAGVVNEGLPAPVALEELGVTELAELVDSLEVDGPVYRLVPASLDDLSEQQLELLLEEMEG